MVTLSIYPSITISLFPVQYRYNHIETEYTDRIYRQRQRQDRYIINYLNNIQGDSINIIQMYNGYSIIKRQGKDNNTGIIYRDNTIRIIWLYNKNKYIQRYYINNIYSFD